MYSCWPVAVYCSFRRSSRDIAEVRQSPHVHASVVFFFRCLWFCILVAARLQRLHFVLWHALQRKLTFSAMDLGYWVVFSRAGCLSHRLVRLQAGFRHILHVVQSGAVQASFVSIVVLRRKMLYKLLLILCCFWLLQNLAKKSFKGISFELWS